MRPAGERRSSVNIAFVTAATAMTLQSNTARIVSMLMVLGVRGEPAGSVMAALFTNMSSRPYRSSMCRAAAVMLASSVTSSRIGWTSWLSIPSAAAVSVPRS